MPEEKAVNRWILPTIMFGPFLSMLDAGIVNVGLPSMAAEFHTTPGGIQWVASVYLLSISALLPLLGSLADQIGRKKIFNLGFLVLSVFSLLSTWAPNLPVLVVSRILQGLGGAMIIANGMALATEHHPASQRGRNLGLLTTVGALGSIVGPALGGLLIGAAGWRSVFYLSAAVAAGGWLASALNIPHDAKVAHTKFALDWLGAALLATAIVAFGLGLASGWAFELLAAALLGAFLLWERRAKHPILRLELFANPKFSSPWILSLVAFLALYTPTVLVPFYFQVVQGWSPAVTGLAMMAFPITMALVSPLSGKLSDRWGSVKLSTMGLFVGAGGLLVLAFVGPGWSPFAVVGGLSLMGLAKKDFLGLMFGLMMPSSLHKLALSKLHMVGMGSWMMKGRMKSLKIDSLQEMLDSAIQSGVRLVACNMSMDVMGVTMEELVDGVESGGVATMLEAADSSRATLFI
ncbi:MAG: MFS transporter [Spirochaetales bacterium]